MAQTGFTPISTYYTTTAGATPTAGNLVNGELALNINTADGKLFYKDSAGVVQVLATKDSTSGSFTNLSYTGTLTGGTGVVNLGSGQFYKDASGLIGIGVTSPVARLDVITGQIAGVSSGLKVASSGNGNTGRGCSITIGAGGNGNSVDVAQIIGYQNTQASVASNAALSFNVAAVTTGTLTERMRIDSSGNVLVGITSATSGGAKLQTVDGITFPATAVASSDANTLDDYEEGTFTPTIVGTGTAGTGTYSTQVGNYTKIGRLVYAKVALTWSAHTGTGNMYIAGLPFTSAAGGVGRSTGSLNIDSVAYTGTFLIASVLDSSTAINLQQATTNAGSTNIPLDTSAIIWVSVCYQV